MPIAYFKCDCGNEQRELIPQDHRGMVKNKRGNWELDLALLRSLPPKPDVPMFNDKTSVCEKCGVAVTSSRDPKSIPTRFHFNYMADDY